MRKEPHRFIERVQLFKSFGEWGPVLSFTP